MKLSGGLIASMWLHLRDLIEEYQRGPEHHRQDDVFYDAMSSEAEEVVDRIQSEEARQRQMMEDRILAHRLQCENASGRRVYEAYGIGRNEQERLERLAIQCAYAHRYALSLRGGDRPSSPPGAGDSGTDRQTSLFALCVDACIEHRIDVAEALESGAAKPIVAGMLDPEAAAPLPLIDRCDVCYDEDRPGVVLACDHRHCRGCMRKVLKKALVDRSLLPLKCCNLPIDMNCSRSLLSKQEAYRLAWQLDEVEATNKMFCPTCNCFLNLDLVDASEASDYLCMCGTMICTVCRTAAHRGLTCREYEAAMTGSDDLLFELSRPLGWKQCPRCRSMIEKVSGCDHMTCGQCTHEFCYRCLGAWRSHGGRCSQN